MYVVNEPQIDGETVSEIGESEQFVDYMEQPEVKVSNPAMDQLDVNNDPEGTSIDNLPTDGSEVDPPPDEVSETEPAETEAMQQTHSPEAEPGDAPAEPVPEKPAPLAEQERDSGLHVPPPSPNNGNTDNEEESKIVVNDDTPDVPEVPTPEKEDIVFVEQEIVPEKQSTPKKEKKEKEKKEKVTKEKKKKEKDVAATAEMEPETVPKERKSRKFHPNWSIPPVYK